MTLMALAAALLLLPLACRGFTVGSRGSSIRSARRSSVAPVSMSVLSTAASVVTVAGIVAFHEAGHLLAAKVQDMKVQSYNVGYGPKLLSFNDSSGTEYALRLIPLGGYVAFPANAEYDDRGEVLQEFDDPDLLQNRPPLQRALVISSGVIANVLLAFLLSTGVALSTGLPRPVFNDGVVVTTAPDRGSPAAAAGILKGDVILSLGKEQIFGSEKSVENFVLKIKASKDVPLPIVVERQGTVLNLQVTPRDTGSRVSIGLGIANNVINIATDRAANIVEAMQQGGAETYKIGKMTVAQVSRFFTSDFNMDAVGGPISVIKAGSQIGEFSLTGLLGFACILSINLAVFNSLPIPALDGGQLLFVVLEMIKGGALPKQAVEGFTRLGFSLMLALGVTSFVGDLSRLGESAIPASASSIIAPADQAPKK